MTTTPAQDNIVFTDRGGVIENRHRVHAAVVDSSGKLLFSIGNPAHVTLIRSSAKPPQALAVLETGAFERYGFDDADLSLTCASHNAEPRHVDRAKAMLAKIHAEESNLRCGSHPAILPAQNRQWIEQGAQPTRAWSNCSGKHAAMLAGAKAIDAPLEGYHLPEHPIQQRVMRVVEHMAGLKPEQVQWGLDGCNMPAPAYPLHYLAKTFAKFAEAADVVSRADSSLDDGGGPPQRVALAARVYNAMVTYPEQVAGEGRFCTTMMRAYKGQLFGKVGADACYGIGVRESEQTRRLGAEGALGIGVKIEDGNLDILYNVMPEILQRLEIGTAEEIEQMDEFHHRKLVNTMGVVTGKVSFPFVIHKA